MFFSPLTTVCFLPSASSLVNLVLFIALVPAVIYASLRPLFCNGHARFLETYQSLPTVSILPAPSSRWDDLSLYLLFLEENISELKSYKYIKVCKCVCFISMSSNKATRAPRQGSYILVTVYSCKTVTARDTT